ncbi:hypothetical protein SC171_07590 [Pantoea cypripedii]|uniref:hypothetical protein n=1 Tax=Pantoea cypripedii TaxID=55209 RepID=UPI002FCAD731
MKMKGLGCFSIFLLIIIVAFYLYVPVRGYFEYKENDLYSYYFYTDKEIKNAPRISDSFTFIYASPDGSQGEMSAIVYTGGGMMRLEEYLKSKGYSLFRKEDNGLTQVWMSDREQKVQFLLSQDKDKSVITLTKVIN